ncbi:hypothetical protein chiPu_0030124, partial [Chiloscyllium punctatum]|nr:hypothetical protein [Chiloscyllium punctatum]
MRNRDRPRLRGGESPATSRVALTRQHSDPAGAGIFASASTERCHGSSSAIAVHRHRHRRGLRAGRARFRADLPRHQRGELRARRILDGRRLSDGGLRRARA